MKKSVNITMRLTEEESERVEKIRSTGIKLIDIFRAGINAKENS